MHETSTTNPEVERWSWMRWPPPAPPPGPTRRPPAGRRMASGSAGRCGEPAAWPAWGGACTGTLRYQKILFKAFLLCLNILNQKEGDMLWTSVVPTTYWCNNNCTLYLHIFLWKSSEQNSLQKTVSSPRLHNDFLTQCVRAVIPPTCHCNHRLSCPVHSVEVGCNCESHEDCRALRQHLQWTWGVIRNLTALDNSPHICIGE